MLTQEESRRRLSRAWIRPTSSSKLVEAEGELPLSNVHRPSRVLLVDEPHPLREQVAAQLFEAGILVIRAAGVHEAHRLVRRFPIDLLIIGGDQRYENIWRSAGKLCGPPPWHGVVLYLGHVSARDRLWGKASELAALVETKGLPELVVRATLRGLGESTRQACSIPQSNDRLRTRLTY